MKILNIEIIIKTNKKLTIFKVMFYLKDWLTNNLTQPDRSVWRWRYLKQQKTRSNIGGLFLTALID